MNRTILQEIAQGQLSLGRLMRAISTQLQVSDLIVNRPASTTQQLTGPDRQPRIILDKDSRIYVQLIDAFPLHLAEAIVLIQLIWSVDGYWRLELSLYYVPRFSELDLADIADERALVLGRVKAARRGILSWCQETGFHLVSEREPSATSHQSGDYEGHYWLVAASDD